MSKRSLTIAALMAAATIGEGVFALPYVIQASGWALALGYFIVLVAAVSVVHIIYLRTIAAVDEKERLLGLAEKYFGRTGFWIGFTAIVVGLLLGFVAYLVLGTEFIHLLFPWIAPHVALIIFWFLLACLIWMSEGKIAGLEVTGIVLLSIAILFIFLSGHPVTAFTRLPFVVPHNFFLPFGAILFSLAGWTSVEQVYEFFRPVSVAKTVFLFALGTAFAVLLYWLFALGVIGGVCRVATDTISGVAQWPVWRKDILALVGLSSVAVISLPLARELRGAVEKDLAWNSIASRAAIIFLPLAVVLSGFNNFLTIISVAGGIFISVQYILIISVGRRTLTLSAREKYLLHFLVFLFACPAVYSLYLFIVR